MPPKIKMNGVLFMKKMNKKMQRVLAAKREKAAAAMDFRCPQGGMMADTCGDCCMLSSSGKCLRYNHYTEPSHWACPWYYTS